MLSTVQEPLGEFPVCRLCLRRQKLQALLRHQARFQTWSCHQQLPEASGEHLDQNGGRAGRPKPYPKPQARNSRLQAIRQHIGRIISLQHMKYRTKLRTLTPSERNNSIHHVEMLAWVASNLSLSTARHGQRESHTGFRRTPDLKLYWDLWLLYCMHRMSQHPEILPMHIVENGCCL